MTDDQAAALLAAAHRAALCAYAPYSGFRVGATVLDGAGNIYCGANVENASYGLALCAERVALATAKVAGCTAIVGVAVACIDAPGDAPLAARTPCGACRQWLAELAPAAAILIAGESRRFTAHELLPAAFALGTPERV